MKRDNDLIKTILLFVEGSESKVFFSQDAFPEGFPDDVPFDVVAYHSCLLLEHGLILGNLTNQSVTINRLTWAGHDFLDDARDATLWNTAKQNAGKLSFTAFREVVKELAKTAAKVALQAALQQAGLG